MVLGGTETEVKANGSGTLCMGSYRTLEKRFRDSPFRAPFSLSSSFPGFFDFYLLITLASPSSFPSSLTMPVTKIKRKAPARGRTAIVPPPERPEIPLLADLKKLTKVRLSALAVAHGITVSPVALKSVLVSCLDDARNSSSGGPSRQALSLGGGLRDPTAQERLEALELSRSTQERLTSTQSSPFRGVPHQDPVQDRLTAVELSLQNISRRLDRQFSDPARVPGTPPEDLLRLLTPPNLSVVESPATGESSLGSNVTDVELRTTFVPEDLRASLGRGEYQIISDWTFTNLSERPTRRAKVDGSRPPEDFLTPTLWVEAGFNMHRCLRSLAADSPLIHDHAQHAEQLLKHIAHVLQSYNAGFVWTRLQTYDRAVRQFKAQHGLFDLGNPARSKDTFERIVTNIPAVAPGISPSRSSSRVSSPFVPRTSPGSPARSPVVTGVCFRCGSRGHLSSSCSATPRPRPPHAGLPDLHPSADGAYFLVCRAWNSGRCFRSACTKLHECVLCYGDHVIAQCPHATGPVSRG